MLESFLIKIVATLLKKAIAAPIIKTIANAFHVYTVIDTANDLINCIETTNSCNDLGVCGVKVVAENLAEAAFDKIVKVGNDSFTVEKTKSGIYVASRYVPKFEIVNPTFEMVKIFSKTGNLSGNGSFTNPFSSNTFSKKGNISESDTFGKKGNFSSDYDIFK
ncbi:MAG: hypothetical protein JW870_19485 [Candidatus Delongbacteria bacterium]|nr:hypothetical protein [Candidatus Delongbacteria bacterium]